MYFYDSVVSNVQFDKEANDYEAREIQRTHSTFSGIVDDFGRSN